MSASEQGSSQHRQRLVEGLVQSIHEKGLAGTQIADIVRHARTSRRTFYECFEDKESCFVELVREATELALESVQAAIDPEAPWETQVDQAIDAYLLALTSDPVVTMTISRELPTLGARGMVVLREGIELYAELVRRIFSTPQMRAAGQPPVSRELATFVIGGLNEMITETAEQGGELARLAPIAKDAVKAVLSRPRPAPAGRDRAVPPAAG